MKEYLIVDGYNIIGAWPELQALKEENLEYARARLIEILFQMDLRFPNSKKLLLENINDTAESKSLTIPQNNQLPDLSPHFSTPH